MTGWKEPPTINHHAEIAAERDRLKAELSAMTQAVGLLSTLAPEMEINVLDPIGMAQTIHETVTTERDNLREALRVAREKLEFYANSEIYKGHPHGIAFDDRDRSYVARSALTRIDQLLGEKSDG